MRKELYLTPVAQEIHLSHEAFVCASANLEDIPIKPASADDFSTELFPSLLDASDLFIF